LPPTSATSPTDRPTLERTGPAEPTPTLARRLAAVAVRARLQRAIVALPPLATGLGAGLAAVFLALDLGAVGEAEALSAAAAEGHGPRCVVLSKHFRAVDWAASARPDALAAAAAELD
jgi:hypothetical protein